MDRSEDEDQPIALPAAEDAALLEENLRLIEDRSDRVINYFYATLFLQSPELRSLFPAAMDAQRDRLFRALMAAVRPDVAAAFPGSSLSTSSYIETAAS